MKYLNVLLGNLLVFGLFAASASAESAPVPTFTSPGGPLLPGEPGTKVNNVGNRAVEFLLAALVFSALFAAYKLKGAGKKPGAHAWPWAVDLVASLILLSLTAAKGTGWIPDLANGL